MTWQERAECRQPGAPALSAFYSRYSEALVARCCAACTVRTECAEAELLEVRGQLSDVIGYRAGMTEGERRERLRADPRHVVTCEWCSTSVLTSRPGRRRFCRPKCQEASAYQRRLMLTDRMLDLHPAEV